ncbi:MAG: DeoR/GlpR transcriptional regulator, partial [Cellulomonas sp.]
MFATERRQRILDQLRDNGAATVRDLARTVAASEGTVRRDLRALGEQGLL